MFFLSDVFVPFRPGASRSAEGFRRGPLFHLRQRPAKARVFYEDFLGYEEAFTLPKADGTVQMAFLKINDLQYVELVNQPNKGEGQLNHLGLYTDDVERMRQYLASRR